MMGKTHAATGALAGAATTSAYLSLTGTDPTLSLAVAGVAVGTGSALLPDLDHPNSTATHALGPLTRMVCLLTRQLSRLAYKTTGTTYDDKEGTHRALTHTLAFAVLAGALVAFAATRWEPVAAVVLWLTTSLALRALSAHLGSGMHQRDLKTLLGVSVAAAAITAALIWAGDVSAPYLGAALGAGMVVHVLGDMITKERAPLLWPAKINGKRWWDLGLPPSMLITTGDDSGIESSIRWGCWAVTAGWAVLLLIPI